LGVEEQFYVILPLLFIGIHRFGKSWIFGSILGLALASFALTFVEINSIHKFYMLYTRFWELAIGSLVAFLPKLNKNATLAYAGLAAILVAIFNFTDKLPEPSYYTLMPTVGTALLIVFARQTIVAQFLSTKPLVQIGLISYSIYLIHQPLFAFARITSNHSISMHFWSS
jgi:peptidoglycan/LPS O-acetylase OafA/YrhL